MLVLTDSAVEEDERVGEIMVVFRCMMVLAPALEPTVPTMVLLAMEELTDATIDDTAEEICDEMTKLAEE